MTEDEQQEHYERLVRECWRISFELIAAPDLDWFMGAGELELLRLTAGNLAGVEATIRAKRKFEELKQLESLGV